MFLRIEKLGKLLLCGHKTEMSLTENKTFELWSGFMPKRNELRYKVNDLFYSVQVYDGIDYFKTFNPHRKFVKWATIEVSEEDKHLDSFEHLTIQEGLYAVFLHEGMASDFHKTANYIYTKWIPESEYMLDDRPHFEILDDRYKRNDPSSKEEVWIPIRTV